MMGGQQQGFTILETLIFLAVSGVLFLGALTMISGKQSKTEFSTGINTIRSNLQSVIGSVANGYYRIPPNLGCQSSASGPVFNSGGSVGTNQGCVYLGEVIDFVPTTNGGAYNSYPVAGLQYAWKSGLETANVTTSLAEAHPTIISLSGVPQVTQTALPYGIKADPNYQGNGSGVCYYDNNTPPAGKCHAVNTNAFALLTTFNSYVTSTSNLTTGSQGVNIIPLPNTNSTKWLFNWGNNQALNPNLTDSCSPFTNVICAPPGVSPNVAVNPSGGIHICLDSGGTNESALYIIGGSNNPTGVSMTHYSSLGCS